MASCSVEATKQTNTESKLNDRGPQGQQTATQQVKRQHVEGAHRTGLQLGDSPEHSLKQHMLPEINTVAAAAQASRPKALVLPSATAPPPAADASPAAAAGTPVAAAALQHVDHPPHPTAASPVEPAHTSSHDSAGTGHGAGAQGAQQQQYKSAPKQQYGQGFVPRKDSNDNIPCFVQTSALFTNMCGYCGTRSTSGCWRRGWEIGPNRFINLCNKCGLRHKAGKLPSVPEPPPPQLRGRAAAAAAAAATNSGGNTYSEPMHHSTSAAELAHFMNGHNGGQGSPNHSTGYHPHETAASDPTAAATQGPTSSGGRRRRAQKPLTPKWSRVGAPAGADYQHDQHMFAQLLAAGAFGNSGASMDMYAGMAGMMGADQQQQQLAALLQSFVEGAVSPGQQGAYMQGADQQCPGSAHHTNGTSSSLLDGTNSSMSLSHYATAGQHAGTAAAAAAAATSPASAAAGMDSAQAVAAVLAAAAAATVSSDSKGGLPSPSPIKLSKLSVVSGTSAFDNSQMSSPAAKKRRTKKDTAGEDVDAATSAGHANSGHPREATQAAQDAAAGDAADALLALRSSAKPESPSWARLQQVAPPSSMPAMMTGAFDSMAMPGMNMNMNMGMGRQVTSPSVDTTIGGRPSPLAHYLQPLNTQHPTGPAPFTHPAPSPYHPGSHLQPLNLSPHSAPQHMSHHTSHKPQGTNTITPPYTANWTPEQVQTWLTNIGCGELAATFKAQGIDGQALSGLVRVVADAGSARLDQRLKGDFGVEGVAQRLRMVDRMMGELTGTHRIPQ